jgi:ABC-type dipeptide/oligopeptide/nickel transport system ATPase component
MKKMNEEVKEQFSTELSKQMSARLSIAAAWDRSLALWLNDEGTKSLGQMEDSS